MVKNMLRSAKAEVLPARRDDCRPDFHGRIDRARGAVEEPVEKSVELAVRAGIVNRCPDNETVGFGKFGRYFVDRVVENTFLVGPAIVAGDAAADILVADGDALGFDSVFVESAFHFFEPAGRAAVWMGTSVDQ